MSDKDLWKYCTDEQIKKLLLEFRLLDGTSVRKEDYFSCLYAVSNHTEQHYHSVRIEKKNGKKRQLLIPDFLLGQIQKNLLQHVLKGVPVSVYATAYKPDSSIVKNAVPHVGAGQILKLDMKGFFDHITFRLVYQYAFPAVYFPPEVRTLLTNLCCVRDMLPQGAPTSPAVSNLVMKPFDEHIGTWCRERQIRYTRYCDDMTFSGDFDVAVVKNKARSFLQVYGFELNERKTKVQNQNCRQTVTGIVVNEKLQVSRAYRRKLRAEIYYCRKFGVESHLQRCGAFHGTGAAKGEKCEETCRRYLQRLLGQVNFCLQVNGEDTELQKERKAVWKLLEACQAQAGGQKQEGKDGCGYECKKTAADADGVETV